MRSGRRSRGAKTTTTADVTTSKSRATRFNRRQLEKNDQLEMEMELNVVSDRKATRTNSKKEHCKKRKQAPSQSKGKKQPSPSSLEKIKKKQKHVESDNKSDNDDDKKLQAVVADDDDDVETKTKSTANSSPPIITMIQSGEGAVDNASLDAASSSALVNAPTTTTTVTTKDKKTKAFLDTSGFPELLDGSTGISFYPDGSNKLIVKPDYPPEFGCHHCGKEFNSFGNIACCVFALPVLTTALTNKRDIFLIYRISFPNHLFSSPYYQVKTRL